MYVSNHLFTTLPISYHDMFILSNCYFKVILTNNMCLICSYLDSNNISGLLVLPYVSPINSSLRLISLINNNITNLQPSIQIDSLLSNSSLQISQLLFLGGNPICNDSRTSELLRMVCRFNRSSPIEGKYAHFPTFQVKVTI